MAKKTAEQLRKEIVELAKQLDVAEKLDNEASENVAVALDDEAVAIKELARTKRVLIGCQKEKYQMVKHYNALEEKQWARKWQLEKLEEA
jgi:hypothetical protein